MKIRFAFNATEKQSYFSCSTAWLQTAFVLGILVNHYIVNLGLFTVVIDAATPMS